MSKLTDNQFSLLKLNALTTTPRKRNASSISKRDYEWENLNTQRNSYDAISKTYNSPNQLHHVYHNEVAATHQRLHERGINMDFDEVMAQVESGEMEILKAPRSKSIPRQAKDELLTILRDEGLQVRCDVASTGTWYLKAYYMIVRIADHPNANIELAERVGPSRTKKYEWRTDLNAGFYYREMRFKSIEELAEAFIEEAYDTGFKKLREVA